jgi:hypothetical protein
MAPVTGVILDELGLIARDAIVRRHKSDGGYAALHRRRLRRALVRVADIG